MTDGNALSPVGKLAQVHLFSIGKTPITASTLATMVLVVVATWIISRLLRAGIHRAAKRRGVEAETGGIRAITRLLHYVVILVGVGVALQTGGIELSALFAAGAVFAVGIGFAMQNIAQNFVSGVILLMERTIKPGDIIEVNGAMVRVKEMGVRATLARSTDEEDLIIPNSTLVQGLIKSYSMQDPLYRLRVKVGVAYDSDLDRVDRVLAEVGAKFGGKDQDCQARVLLVEFGANSVDWELSLLIHEPWNRRLFGSALRRAIWDAFRAEGIVIAFPQVDVHFDAPVTAALSTAAAVARATHGPS